MNRTTLIDDGTNFWEFLAAYYAERGVHCNRENNFCAGTAENPYSAGEPEEAWYAIRGTYDG